MSASHSAELVTLRLPSALPAIPGPADVVAALLSSCTGNTRRAYESDLEDFARFLGVADPRLAVEAFLGMTRAQANAVALGYRTFLTDRGEHPLRPREKRKLSPATIARRLAAVRKAVKLARTLGRVDWSLDIPSPRVEAYRDTRGPDLDQWNVVLASTRAETINQTAIAARDLAMLLLLGDRVLRRGELVGIDYPDDFDTRRPAVAIVGKGRTQREWVTINLEARAALLDWIRVRTEAPGPLFIRLDRAASELARLTTWGVWHITRRLGRRAGLARDLAPHQLRHSGITRALDKGWDVRDVRHFSRHAKLETILRYDDRRKDVAGEITRSLAGE
jgi:integrase/recombinase XerC